MGFHPNLFPVNLSRGTSGGPGFKTIVRASDTGFEGRSSSWDNKVSRQRFDVSKTVQNATDVAELIASFRTMRGPGFSFLYKNRADWTTHPDHVTLPVGGDPTHRGPVIGSPDGSTKVFQLAKTYTDAATGTSFTRKITRPINPVVGINDWSTAIYINGLIVHVNGISVGGWNTAIDYDTGTFHIESTAGAAVPFGNVIECSVSFYTLVTYHPDMDAGFDVSWVEGGQYDFSAIEMIEVAVDHSEGHEEHHFGGGNSTAVALFDMSPHFLDMDDGYHQTFDSSAATGGFGGTVVLPNVSNTTLFPNWVTGGPVCVIEKTDASAEIVRVVSASGSQSLAQITAQNQSVECWFVGGPATAEWFAR